MHVGELKPPSPKSHLAITPSVRVSWSRLLKALGAATQLPVTQRDITRAFPTSPQKRDGRIPPTALEGTCENTVTDHSMLVK